MVSRDQLLAAVIHYFRAIHGDDRDESVFWGWQELTKLVRQDPDAAWQVLWELIPAVSDSEEALANVAAGPLEDLLRFNGKTHVDVVIAAAARVPAVRDALSMIWIDSFDADVRQKLQQWARSSGIADDS